MTPGGFGSLTQFAKSQKTPYDLRKLERSLSRIEAFSRHRRTRRRYLRPAIILNRPFFSYCTDLMIMENKRLNGGYAYILLLQDMYTKEIAMVAIKRKDKTETAAALEKALLRLSKGGRRLGKVINSDGGLEYSNRNCRAIYKKYNLEHRVLTTGYKQAICERTNLVIKQYLYKMLSFKRSKRWVDLLRLVENKYNSRKHHATLMAPRSINLRNNEIAFRNMYRKLVKIDRKPPKFSVGDTVRVLEPSNIFSKKYKPGFSKEVYTVIKIKPTFPHFTYRIENSSKEEVDRTFADEELSLAVLE